MHSLLNDTHRFPGPYRVKVIGENSPAFVKRVAETAVAALHGRSCDEITERPSAKGTHLGVTLTFQINSAEEVLAVYEALRNVEGLRMVL